MPLFYQQDINEDTKLGVWILQETEEFFLSSVPLQRTITHPHKRLQHLAGRYLLKYLYPDFPYELIRIADTRKPFLQNEKYHFSISHCGDYAAAIVSRTCRVGVDVELATPRILRILSKFLHPDELQILQETPVKKQTIESFKDFYLPTLLWSVKESIFKWHGNGGVDFSEHIRLGKFDVKSNGKIPVRFFNLFEKDLEVYFKLFDPLWLSWVWTDHTG